MAADMRRHPRVLFASIIISAIIGSSVLFIPPGRVHALPNFILGDLNGDGIVNVFDLSFMLNIYGKFNAGGDLDFDGHTDIFDLSILLNKYGLGIPVSPIPTGQPVELTNSDNGRAFNVSYMTYFNVRLAQLPGVAGYHWNETAGNLYWYGSPTITHGADGSLTEIGVRYASTGQTSMTYADIPDCYPACSNQHPLQYWHVNLNLQ